MLFRNAAAAGCLLAASSDAAKVNVWRVVAYKWLVGVVGWLEEVF